MKASASWNSEGTYAAERARRGFSRTDSLILIVRARPGVLPHGRSLFLAGRGSYIRFRMRNEPDQHDHSRSQ